jgi:drug/metabolite transporter (DMT)-like permease
MDTRTHSPPSGAELSRGARFSIFVGIAWALFTVVIWGGWPAYTRLAVTHSLSPEDLVALRFAIGGLILLPVLVRGYGVISPAAWREGVVLAICQGAPLALLVTVGLRYAPASHMAALSPGLLPLFAALLGVLFYDERLGHWRRIGLALISAGALVMVSMSFRLSSDAHLKGDLLFVCAGFIGAIYTVRMRRSGLTAMQGAALISVYSMICYLPLYCWQWLGQGRLFEVSGTELLLQAMYQGVLMGAVALFSLSRAIIALGAVRAAAFISLVPVLGTIFGILILHEFPSSAEIAAVAAISLGVLLTAGVMPVWRMPSK